jgi:hypothetical protein
MPSATVTHMPQLTASVGDSVLSASMPLCIEATNGQQPSVPTVPVPSQMSRHFSPRHRIGSVRTPISPRLQ